MEPAQFIAQFEILRSCPLLVTLSIVPIGYVRYQSWNCQNVSSPSTSPTTKYRQVDLKCVNATRDN